MPWKVSVDPVMSNTASSPALVFPDSESLYVRGIQTSEELPREQWQEESHPRTPQTPHPTPTLRPAGMIPTAGYEEPWLQGFS